MVNSASTPEYLCHSQECRYWLPSYECGLKQFGIRQGRCSQYDTALPAWPLVTSPATGQE
jgi:hypothetical protein